MRTRFSDTIDNVKAKIDNVKAKTQDEEDQGPLSRPSLTRHLIPSQFGASLTSSQLEGPPPTTLRLARQAAHSCEQFPTLTEAWGHDTRRDPGTRTSSPRCVGDRFPTPCKHTSWWPVRAAGPDRSLNTGLVSWTTITSPSSPTLLHASSAGGTQAPPTMRPTVRP
jgi:hypothetical protein